ncbi:hypothetical protein BX666DRAFT_1919599, partial [Dichotomocladium elegans]
MKSLLLLLSYLFVGSVLAVPHAAISGGGCVLLDTKIYCYGGTLEGGKTNGLGSSAIMSLDIASNFSVSTARSNWTEVEPVGGLSSDTNAHFSMVAVPYRDSFVVSGGMGGLFSNAPAHQTVMFNVLTRLWSTIDTVNQTEIYDSAMVIGNDAKIYLWGGVSDELVGAENTSYPNDMRILDLQSMIWTLIPYPDKSTGRLQHSAALSSDGKTIYFFGGSFNYQFVNASFGYTLSGVDMSNIVTFDTTASQWGSVNTTSSVTPTRRRFHTSERIPGTNTVLIYGGGDGNNTAVSDYCYTLDLDTLQWERIELADGGAGPRYSHSMVFANNSAVFILFGSVNEALLYNDFHVLNISTWSWMERYPGLAGSAITPNNSTDTTNPNDGERSKSNTGAIAGGVVGGVAGVALIAAAIFFMRRKRKSQPSPHEAEKVKDKIIDLNSIHDDQSGTMATNTEHFHDKGNNPARPLHFQARLVSTDGNTVEYSNVRSPAAANKPSTAVNKPDMFMPSVKPDG